MILWSGIGDRTRSSYASHQNSLLHFCRIHDIPFTLPASEDLLCLWMAWLSKRLSFASIRVYLFGIRSLHVDSGWPDPMLNKHRIARMLRGIKRNQGINRSKPRLPITLAILQCFRRILDFSRHDHRMLFAAMSTATCGLFRIGEIASYNVRPTADLRLLLFSDIHPFPLPSSGHPLTSHYIIHLKTSKTDPFRKGVDCPVSHPLAVDALQNYFSHHPLSCSPSLPLFSFSDGAPLTRNILIACTKECLHKIGHDHSAYSGVSFRRGGATSLGLAGVQDRLIKLLGRWKGWSYSLYTETPLSTLINLGKKM
jgi:hypothetical protein